MEENCPHITYVAITMAADVSIHNHGTDLVCQEYSGVTHWGRVTQICVGKLTLSGS